MSSIMFLINTIKLLLYYAIKKERKPKKKSTHKWAKKKQKTKVVNGKNK